MGLIYCQDEGFDCSLCRLKRKCQAMCPPIEWCVAEIEIEQQERPLNPARDIVINSWPETLSTGEIVLQKYFRDRMAINEIAQQLDISRQYVHKTIAKAKKIIAENIKKQPKTGDSTT